MGENIKNTKSYNKMQNVQDKAVVMYCFKTWALRAED